MSSDADLLARCRARDGDAWRALTARYQRLIFSVALRNGLDEEDAADVTQATFVALFDALEDLRDADKLKSWLMTVARRQSWRIRTRQRRTVDLEQAPEQVVDPFDEWETKAVLRDAIDELDGPPAELIRALFFDPTEPSCAEIAEQMGRSIGGIGPLRGRTLQHLRERINDT